MSGGEVSGEGSDGGQERRQNGGLKWYTIGGKKERQCNSVMY